MALAWRQLTSGQIRHHVLEKSAGLSAAECVSIRRRFLTEERGLKSVASLPDAEPSYYDAIRGTNCENVVGTLHLPGKKAE